MCEDGRDDELQRFCRQESAWLHSIGQGETVYCIPPKVIDWLAAPRRPREPLIDSVTAARERRFWNVCRHANACGVYGDEPILYPCLWEPYGLTPAQLKKILYPIFGDVFDAETLMLAHTGAWERLQGYAGWLVTDPGFIRERDRLRTQWENLPDTMQPRPPFKLTSSLEATAIEAVEEYSATFSSTFAHRLPLTKMKVAFLKAVSEFLRRWNLCQLTTWDLPLPFGPLLADDLGKHTQAIPEHSVQLILPIHYPLTTSDSLVAVIRERQQQVAREHGLSPQIAALPHYTFLGRMLQVQHIEQTIRSRYSGTGAVTLVERAVAAFLGVSVAQTAKLRKAVSACRRGKRDHVPSLNVRT
jgi:hypothetical protein